MATSDHLQSIKVGNKIIENFAPTFVIAEVGINHNGDFKLAEKLIREAKKSGADAVKFQTYTTEKRVAKDNPVYDILKKCELSFAQQKELSEIAQKEGICFFSTPFDEESADFLVEIKTPLFKIASFDIVNLQLLRHVASKGIPIIVSRGMANEQEIDKTIEIFDEHKLSFILLHCVSSYPTNEEDANLRIISALKKKYQCVVGYSDHTLGIRTPVLAVAVGAQVIEKHFTLDTQMEGPDQALSCDPKMLADMILQIRDTEKILGGDEIKMGEAEKSAVIFRRSTT